MSVTGQHPIDTVVPDARRAAQIADLQRQIDALARRPAGSGGGGGAPSGPAGGSLSGTYPNPTIAAGVITDTNVAAANKDGVAGTASMRTLGTGAQQAAAGNHNHTGVYQPLDGELTALAGLASTADTAPYFTGSGAAALATLTAFGRSLIDDPDATTARGTLGLGSAATMAGPSGTIVGTSDAQTLTNKTIQVKDNVFTLQDDLDATKQAQFQASGITTATTRTYTLPNATGTLALTSDLTTYAPLASPALTGTPTAPTAAVDTNTTQVATTAFVLAQAASASPLMDGAAAVGTSTRFARQDHVHPSDTSRAPLASPALTGTPTAPTAATADNSTAIATTAFVKAQSYAPLASPALTGTPTVPTAAVDTNTTQAASTAFVLGQAASASPLMDGAAAVGTSTRYARQDHVHPTDTTRAPLASPALTGTPTVPTAAVDTNTTQAASTAFVLAQAASASPLMDGTATVGTSTRFARQDHVHPTDTSRAPLASPALTGTPTAPTAAPGTNTTQLATTAYVGTAIAANIAFVSNAKWGVD